MISFMDLDFYATEGGTEAWVQIDETHGINIAMKDTYDSEGRWCIEALVKGADGAWRGLNLNCFEGADEWLEHNLRNVDKKLKEAQTEISKMVRK